jgi:hypothetical protein
LSVCSPLNLLSGFGFLGLFGTMLASLVQSFEVIQRLLLAMGAVNLFASSHLSFVSSIVAAVLFLQSLSNAQILVLFMLRLIVGTSSFFLSANPSSS